MGQPASGVNFLSLKWKAFLLTSTLITLIFAGFIVGSSIYFHRQFETTRTESFQRYNAEVEVLILQSVQRLQQLAASVGALQGMNVALREEAPDMVQSAFENYWWQLQLDSGIESASIFGSERQLLAQFGHPVGDAEFVQQSFEREQPQWEVYCQATCELYVSVPLLVGSSAGGAVVLSAPLSDVVLGFSQISGADMGILVASGLDRERYLPAWQASLVAITNSAANLELVSEASRLMDLSFIRHPGGTVEWRDQLFELRSIPLATGRGSASGDLLIISNVTVELRRLQGALRNGALYGLFGLLIAEPLLMVLLWGPMTRLRETASQLPLLAESGFEQVRERLSKAHEGSWFRDESHILSSSAVSLSHQLEEMQSQLHQRAEQLEEETSFITGLLNTAHALILTQNESGEIQMVNQHGAQLSGYRQEELVGMRFTDLIDRSERNGLIVYQLRELLRGISTELHHEADLIQKSGRVLHMSWYHSVVSNRGGSGRIVLTVALDISERKRAEDHLGWLANHDPLTGLINRRRFSEELEQTIANCRRYSHSCAILYFDLDQFKDVNDTSGHLVGDQLLKCVAKQLQKAAREADTLARLGGDEFALILHETNADEVGETAERFCRSLSEIAVEGRDRVHRVSSSIGIALYPEHGEYIEELLANADIAMYHAKEAGRNRWRVFNQAEQGRERIQERVYWNEKVKQALRGESFTLFYQPILHIGSGQVSHYEALLRVYDDDGKMLSPQKFILSAEQSGLIMEMDQQIINLVIAQQSVLQAQDISTRLSINLSGFSFRNPSLPSYIQESLERHQVDPRSLIFEITETSAVSDMAATAESMEAVKKLGCQFALDDFGVGFSSIYYLKQLPIDYLKIDGSFIKRIHEEPDDQVLVKALVEISRAFGQFTVAEFVENQEVVELLQGLGVDYAQGYHIDKPKPAEEIWPDVEDVAKQRKSA